MVQLADDGGPEPTHGFFCPVAAENEVQRPMKERRRQPSAWLWEGCACALATHHTDNVGIPNEQASLPKLQGGLTP